MHKLLFVFVLLSVPFLLLNAAHALCEPQYPPKKIVACAKSADQSCESLGRAVLDGDGKNIIICLYKNGASQLAWVNATQVQTSVDVIPLNIEALNAYLILAGVKCADPYVKGGFSPCNLGCEAFCTALPPSGLGRQAGVISEWVPATEKAQAKAICTCYR